MENAGWPGKKVLTEKPKSKKSLYPSSIFSFLKSSLGMVAGEGRVQGEKPQDYRKIALSVLFLGQLWR